MKKFTFIALIALLITPSAFAENIDVQAISAPVPTLISNENTSEVIVEEKQEEVMYNYYYSPTCGWCQKLDNFLNSHNAFDTLNINKIDVRTRGVEMVEAAEEHGIDGASVGTPFVTYGPNGTGSAIETGYYGALELFAQALNVEAVEPTYETDASQRLIIIILGLLIIVGPLAYLGLKK